MSPELAGRTAVVTGAAKGIGRACAEALGAEGAHVVLVDLDEHAGEEAAAAMRSAGAESLFVRGDVSRAADAEHVAGAAVDTYGGIDVLVNNAGIQRYGTVVDTPEDVWDEVLGVNLKGVYLMSRSCLPHILASGGGAIVNIASVQGLQSQPRVAAYAASKGGVINLTRSMAVDFAPQVRVNAVCPGPVDTPLLQWAAGQRAEDPEAAESQPAETHPTRRLGRPGEIADAVVFLAGPRSSFISGAYLVADGGYTAKL